MRKEFRLPDVGEGLTEADIVSWHVKPGAPVTINQIIVDIETAKAVVELPSPFAGTVAALLVEEGQTVDVGTPIIAIEVPSPAGNGPEPAPSPRTEDTPAEETPPKDAPPTGKTPEARQPVLVGYGVKPGSTSRRPRKKPPTRPGSYPATPSSPPHSGPFPPPGAFPAGIKLPPAFRLPHSPPDGHSPPEAPPRKLRGSRKRTNNPSHRIRTRRRRRRPGRCPARGI